MRPLRWLPAFALVLSIASSAAPARAAHGEASDYPVAFVARPLTLPRLTLAPELVFDVNHVPGNPVDVGINLGATFGIMNDLEVGLFFLPLTFAPRFGYGSVTNLDRNVEAFATYRFLHKERFDMGARFRVFAITQGGGGAVLEPSVPLLLHIGNFARLDAEVGIPIAITRPTTTNGVAGHASSVGVDVPISIAFDIIEPLHVGATTGVKIEDLGHPKESTVIPLGVFAGFAVGNHRPVLDIDTFFTWGAFLQPGGDPVNNGSTFNPGVWTLGLALRGYAYF